MDYPSAYSKQSEEPEGLDAAFLPPTRQVSGCSLPPSTMLPVSLAVLFVSAILMDLLGKKTAIAAPSYPYALTQLSPFVGLVVYGAACVVAFYSATLSPEALRFDKRKAMLIGLLFSTYNVVQNLGNRGNVVPGALVVMISKLIVPMSFVFEMLPPLRKRHDRFRVAGCVILLTGIALAIVPTARHESFEWGSELGRVVLLVLGVIPLAIALLYVEVQLSSHPSLYVPYLWLWICVFEFLVGIPLAWFNAYVQELPMHLIWSNFVDGLGCICGGVSSGGVYSSTNACDSAALWYYLGIPAGLAFNMAMALSTRHGGATLMWFVRAVSVPTTGLLFSVRGIMGSATSVLTAYDVAGLCAVFLGLVVFNYVGLRTCTAARLKRRQEMSKRSDSFGAVLAGILELKT